VGRRLVSEGCPGVRVVGASRRTRGGLELLEDVESELLELELLRRLRVLDVFEALDLRDFLCEWVLSARLLLPRCLCLRACRECGRLVLCFERE
jgi:hypothetical protein